MRKYMLFYIMNNQDAKIAKMLFSSVYPLYVTKVERKGRSKAELHEIIRWLTGYSEENLQSLIDQKITFEEFFQHATFHQDAKLITGVICGYRVEHIENTLTQKVRYLDKIVDELAKGRAVEKIIHRKRSA